MQISASLARRFVLTRQHLAGPRVAPTVAGIMRIVRDLKYVQLDPTSAVARSHLLVLWSRLGPYDPALLGRLLWRSQRLLEYSAFIVPAEDYAIYRPRMRKFATGNSPWRRRVRAWMAKNSGLRRHVLTALRSRGPLASDEFEDRAVSSWQSSGWTARRNVNGCLNFSVPQACWSLQDAVEASASGISPRIPFLLGPRARRLPSVRPNGGGRSTHLPRWGSRIINRPRTEELFKFHFRMEIYVPKAQRQFGYFVMPILHGDRLIGRIDPVFNRERRQLRLNRIFAEADAPQDRSTGAGIAGAVESLAEFLGARDIVYPSDVPSGWKRVMR